MVTMHEDTQNTIVLLICCSLFIWTSAAWGESRDDILGMWNNEERDGIIEIFKCREKYCGRIVWAKEPTYPADDKMGREGLPRRDDNNSNPDLRSRPIIGLQIMSDFVFDGDNGWKGGTVYDPRNGRIYSGKVTLVSPNELRLRGYVLFSFLGRTTIWTRMEH